MAVHLRQKELKNGLMSLYLDYYPPVKKSDGKFTRREFLGRTLYKKPKNEEEKRINKENLNFANLVRLKREKGILNEEDGIYTTTNKKKDFLEYFRNQCEIQMNKKGNYDNYLGSLHYLIAFTGGKLGMGDINEEFCNRYKNYLLTADRLNTIRGLKLSQNSAVSYFNKFKATVTAAFEERLIKDNPTKFIKGIPPQESKREFLTQEELQKLAQTDCDLPLIKTACLFSALTGLRWSDISNLKWKDIQHTSGTGYFLHIIQKKTKDVMVHPINDKAVMILGEPREPLEQIFYGLKYNDSNNNRLKRWILKAGINKKITLHNFRHTYATLILNKGADIFTVSKLLGHKNIKTTMIYSKLLTEKKVNAANLIDFEI